MKTAVSIECDRKKKLPRKDLALVKESKVLFGYDCTIDYQLLNIEQICRTQNVDNLPVIIFWGDDIHLPPVCDQPVYNCDSRKPAAEGQHWCGSNLTRLLCYLKLSDKMKNK